MERALKWLLPLLIVVEFVLVRAGWLDAGSAVMLAVGVEVLLVLVAGRQVIVAVRRYRSGRTAGLDGWAALEDGLSVLLPRRVARVVALEPRLWACLLTWLRRRGRRTAGEFSYHRRSIVGLMLVIVVVSTPAELLLVELFVPWAWLRWLLLVAALYGLLWLVGFYASLVTLPHRLAQTGIRLYYGVLVEGQVPYAAIEQVELRRRNVPGGRDGLQLAPSDEAAYLAVGGRTDVTLTLSTPIILRGLLRSTPPVRTVHLAADQPAALAAALEERIHRQMPVAVAAS